MSNYLTSNPFKLTKTYRRYSVLYESLKETESFTLGVYARSMSEAITLVSEFIDGHSLHQSGTDFYFLTPSLVGKKCKTNYLVNEK